MSNDIKIRKMFISKKNIEEMRKGGKKFVYNIRTFLKNKNLTHSQCIRFGQLFQHTIKHDILASIPNVEIIPLTYFDIYGLGDTKYNKGKKDADVLFKYNNILYYFEVKTNLELDSEKAPATDQKIIDFNNYFKMNLEKYNCERVMSGCLTCWYEYEKGLPNNLKTSDIYYMGDFFKILNIDISKEEYMKIMSDFGGQI